MRGLESAFLALALFAPALYGQAVTRADTVPPVAVAETTFRFRSGNLTLEGTLTVPRAARGRVPLGIIIAGSGPTDRNANSAMGLRCNSYAQLAWRLGEQGIATLRYDKRGVGGSRGAVGDPTQLTFDMFATDARAAAEALRGDPRFSTVAFLGHSEGAWLALRAAQVGAPVAGVALLEGAGRPFVVLVRWQLARQFDSVTLVRYDSAMARYVRGQDPGDVPPALGILFLPVNRTFVQSVAAFDPLAAIAAVRRPVLIVQGEADIQVGVEDARLLKQARGDAQLVLLPGMNHVLKLVVGEGLLAQQPLYADPTTPIIPDVVTAIAAWMRRVAR